MTWSSLNRWRNCKRILSPGRLTWKGRNFGSTCAKPRSWYLGWDSMCFKSPAKDHVPWVSRTSAQAPFSVVIVPVGSCWVHKRCSGSFGTLKPDSSLRCKRCIGQARPVDGRPMIEVTVGREMLEVMPSFCHILDCLSSGGGCELDSITRCCVAWRKFNELLPTLTPTISHHLQRKSLQFTRQECHAPCKLGPGPQPYLITHNSIIIYWIYWLWVVTAKDQVSSQDLLERMQLDDLAKVLCTRRLRWHGQVAMVGWRKSRNSHWRLWP